MVAPSVNPLQVLANAMAPFLQGESYKAVGSPTGVNAHGPGGLFSSRGLQKPLFSAMVLPKLGVGARLPIRYSNDTNPLFGLITGVTSSSGTDPVNTCDNPKAAGTMKLCTHSFVFGLLSRSTQVFDLKTAGQVINRGEFTDLQIYGGLGIEDNPMVPSMPGGVPNMTGAASRTATKAIYELAVSWLRDFAPLVYTSDPANNSAGGGTKYFYGFDKLINTGYQDAEKGILCPAADSIIENFNSVDITANVTNTVRKITSIWRRLKFLATHTGMDPVSWTISMPQTLFYELTEIWPIAYSTVAAAVVPLNATLFVQDDAKIQMRDNMRGDMENYTGQYLMIDGQKVPVIIDNAIAETQNAGGSFTSQIYFIPMMAANQPVTFWEYFNYDAPGAAAEMAAIFAPDGLYRTTDGGRFLWERKAPNNGCVQLSAWMAPRLMLLTPYLAARLINVKYSTMAKERAWNPSDPSFYVNGGRTAGDTTDPSYYAPTR